MDLYEAIERRRTIRIYKDAATEEQLKKIIIAGTKAPSAVNCQPWEFVVVEDPSIIDRLADIKYRMTLHIPANTEEEKQKVEKRAVAQKKSFKNAAIVAVCSQVDRERSVWLCIENMLLAAVAEGLGSGIVVYSGEERAEAGKVLGLPSDYELTAILKIGVPGEKGYAREENPYAPRRPEFSWLHKNRYQGK